MSDEEHTLCALPSSSTKFGRGILLLLCGFLLFLFTVACSFVVPKTAWVPPWALATIGSITSLMIAGAGAAQIYRSLPPGRRADATQLIVTFAISMAVFLAVWTPNWLDTKGQDTAFDFVLLVTGAGSLLGFFLVLRSLTYWPASLAAEWPFSRSGVLMASSLVLTCASFLLNLLAYLDLSMILGFPARPGM